VSVEETARIISFVVAPVVMITSCAILIGGMLTQYGANNERLPALARERLDHLRMLGAMNSRLPPVTGSADAPGPQLLADTFTAERLREIDVQLPQLLRRHKHVHDALLTTYGAILSAPFYVSSAACSPSPSRRWPTIAWQRPRRWSSTWAARRCCRPASCASRRRFASRTMR
jgi:hypothetical protein